MLMCFLEYCKDSGLCLQRPSCFYGRIYVLFKNGYPAGQPDSRCITTSNQGCGACPFLAAATTPVNLQMF